MDGITVVNFERDVTIQEPPEQVLQPHAVGTWYVFEIFLPLAHVNSIVCLTDVVD